MKQTLSLSPALQMTVTPIKNAIQDAFFVLTFDKIDSHNEPLCSLNSTIMSALTTAISAFRADPTNLELQTRIQRLAHRCVWDVACTIPVPYAEAWNTGLLNSLGSNVCIIADEWSREDRAMYLDGQFGDLDGSLRILLRSNDPVLTEDYIMRNFASIMRELNLGSLQFESLRLFLLVYPTHKWVEAHRQFLRNAYLTLAHVRVLLIQSGAHLPVIMPSLMYDSICGDHGQILVPTTADAEGQRFFLSELHFYLQQAGYPSTDQTDLFQEYPNFTVEQVLDQDLIPHAGDLVHLLGTNWSVDETLRFLDLTVGQISLHSCLRLLDFIEDEPIAADYIAKRFVELMEALALDPQDINGQIMFNLYEPLTWSIEHQTWYRENKVRLNLPIQTFGLDQAQAVLL